MSFPPPRIVNALLRLPAVLQRTYRSARHRKAAAALGVLMLICAGLATAIAAPNDRSMPDLHIAWRSGTSHAVAVDAKQAALQIAAASDGATRHLVVQFREPIGASEHPMLKACGVTLLSYLGQNAYFASVSGARVDTGRLEQVSSLAYAARVEPEWKLGAMLASGAEPTWAVVARDAGGDPVIGTYVLFHRDVALAEGARAAAGHGAVVRDQLESINGLVIEIAQSNIGALAQEDGVSYIEAALPRLGKLNNSSRILVEANTVQSPPYNLDGSGVTAVVYDDGGARRADGAIHPDLAGHLTLQDASPASAHASHVAGTLGGDGSMSGGLWRGMAPGVSMLSYGSADDGTGTFLYTNPGDLETDYANAITVHGAAIANNSIGTNVCANTGAPLFLSCSITGDYGVTSALIDAIIRGSLGTPFRSIWANGNERSCTACPLEHQDGYHSTAPPACAKNHISVGAVSSDVDLVTNFSSWGPCDDGRMKPDICGPGCQVGSDFGVTSCDINAGVFGYAARSGTSMAAPAVSGLSALLLQDYRDHFPNRPDVRNATLKTCMAHCAVDLDNDGPDYRCGYGSVRIRQTVDFMRTGSFLEDQVDHLGTYTTYVVVAPGASMLKATLAWDDEAAAPNVNHSLVNDLDLRVFDEAGVEYFPWTLDPLNPAAPAKRDHHDHDNNMEQVRIDVPAPGIYRVEVHGTNVPFGPQPFSLCTTPTMVRCTSTGKVTLDQTQYMPGDSAVLQVVDCDLNANSAAIENVTVTLVSDSSLTGQAVVLTEVAPDAGIFRGSITISGSGTAGSLLVAVGDTITATYTDVDDGLGGINVVVVNTATVVARPLVVNLEVGAINSLVTRDVTFVLTDCTGATSETITLPVSFDASGLATVILLPTNSAAAWISANGSLTLRRLMPLASPWPLSVNFVGADRLLAGDFNGDGIVDIQDLSILASIFNTLNSSADSNGDGVADTIDFTAVTVNFFSFSDPVDGCGP
ncbi:MAG: S8 family serine peptidase [Phycisphaerae bacterium]